MSSHRGLVYDIILTSLILGVSDFVRFAKCASPAAPTSIQNTIMYDFPPSAPTSSVLFSSPPRNLDVAESASFFSDGVIASHPLHGVAFTGPGLTGFMNIRGGHNPFLRSSMSAPGADILQTAAQTYFIEPAKPTTTTQRPSYKKRKTRRPISALAEQNKNKQAVNNDNVPNEITPGSPAHFNPFRQIVNTSFGRSRPSDSKLGRSRSRPGAADKQEKPETGSATGTDTNKNIDSFNEIPSTSTEGEPRALGQRRRPQDVRPIRPSSPISPLSSAKINENNDHNNNGGFTGESQQEVPKPRRFPPRPRLHRPRVQPEQENENNPTGGSEPVTNSPPVLPPRPRNLSRRPRPTTTFPSTEDNTEFTAGVTFTQPPQTQPPQTLPPQTQPPQPQQQEVEQQEPRRARPGRPLGGVRFGGGRLTLTTTPLPEPENENVPALPSRPRRPIRPSTSTTRQASPSTEAPEVSRLPQFPTGAGDVPRIEPRPNRGDRQGFILRPRPTSSPEGPRGNSDIQQEENDVTQPRPTNRRRKRPTTTAETPEDSNSNVRGINNNQRLTGGVVQRNVEVPGNFPIQNEGNIPARRIPQVLRGRPTQSPSPDYLSTYQIQEEQPAIQPIGRGQNENLKNPSPEEQPNPGTTSGQSPALNAGSLLRRPVGPSVPAAIQPQAIQPQIPIQSIQPFVPTNQALTGSNNFINSGLYNFPSQDNLGFYPGFDNVLGVSSNLKTVQESANVNQLQTHHFSARTTTSSDEPEISHSDSAPASSSEKQSDTPTESTSNPPSAENENTEKKEEVTTPPKKLSPLERLHQNRQSASRRLLTPRKPTEKTTPAPPQNQKPGKPLRKSIIPPRMLRPRGKLPQKEEEKAEESSASSQENNNGEDKSIDSKGESINESASSSVEQDADSNAVSISPKSEEQVQTSSRKPSILENAMRRRIPIPGRNNASSSPLNKQPAASTHQEKSKITPPPPSNHDSESDPPNCEAGQRYSKFLKRCVTMYKPKASGAQG